MRRLLDGLFEWTGRIAALFVLAIFVLMIYASVGRMLDLRVGWVNDVVAWFCAAAAFLAMGHAFKHGDFVRVTLVLDKVNAGVRRGLEIVSLAIAAVSVSYLTWWATRFTYESFTFHDMAGGMVVIPIWVPQMAFVVGAIVLLLAVLDELWLVLRGEKPTYVRLVEERHARGDYSEDI
ncbi:TRAP transporter small permease subunit [Pseudorhodoferax sp. Leaf265]|uniref:TRAP transporter small permease subunit n=1 Tax=Pseudorhodoferax sp. Leaf265 TaxID=1736315 RepID=UPI0006F7A981|nr:TRAP transporter small permease [Pseudorhodoferax sp. Leaf265]KQP21292.1 C4-dicarboxylate ABC transporter permease [Pseudorhodoferax sp. Leaf265]